MIRDKGGACVFVSGNRRAQTNTRTPPEFIDQRIIRVDLSWLPLEDAFVNYFNYSSVAILFSCKLIRQLFHTLAFTGLPVR